MRGDNQAVRRRLSLRYPLSLRNRLALVFFAITLLAVGGLYLFVVPGLQSRLMSAKLNDLTIVAREYSGPIRRTVGSYDAAATGAQAGRPVPATSPAIASRCCRSTRSWARCS